MASIRTVGVVGAGTMGTGIALLCASSGFRTLLYDKDGASVDQSLIRISGSLDGSVEKGRLTAAQRKVTLSRLQRIRTLDELKVDLVIEAAVEQLDVKRALFQQIEAINGTQTILSTNTSSISVSAISQSMRDPSRCIGLHFFNPADRMKLVEVVSTPATAPAVRNELLEFAAAIGKTSVEAKDSPGFIVNRVARPYYAEALKLVDDKKADLETIDALMKSTGFKMGPFELMDLIGVDINLSVTTSVWEGLGRPGKFKPSATQQDLVRKGNLGRKTGQGFYSYAKNLS
jgi:3-hydroxybutyryl-CoA dehydrogenase